MPTLPEIKILPSGAKLELNQASFAVANRLLQTVARELKAVNVDIEIDLAKLGDELGKAVPVDVLKNGLMQLLGSEALLAALWPCAVQSLYNGQKITSDTFESAEARADFLPVAWEVMWLNLSPFFKGLASLFSTVKAEAGASQK